MASTYLKIKNKCKNSEKPNTTTAIDLHITEVILMITMISPVC